MLVSDMEMSTMRRKRAGPSMGAIAGHVPEPGHIAHGGSYRQLSTYFDMAGTVVRSAAGCSYGCQSWGSSLMVPLSVRAVMVFSDRSTVSTSVSISPLPTVSKTA